MSQKTRLTVGMTVDGRYRITRILGRWRIGTAFEVNDVQADELRTLLTLDLVAGRGHQYLRWVRREGARARTMPTDLLLPLGGGCLEPTLAYLVTGPFRGSSMLQVIRNGGPFDERKAARVGERLARLVAAAHHAGLYIGGLRPTTILLDPGDDDETRPSVFDLGLARGLSDFINDAPAAAAAYQAPDRDPEGAPDAAGDVFATGALLYYMLTGQKPPAIKPNAGALAQPPSWTRRDAPLAAYLDPVVLKAMAPRARERHSTLDDLASALKALGEVFGLSPAAREMLGLPTPEPIAGFAREATNPYLLHDFLGLPKDEDEEEHIETLSMQDLEDDD